MLPRIGSGRAWSSEDCEVSGGRTAGEGIEMADHASPRRAGAIWIKQDPLRSAGTALAEECRQGSRRLGTFDVAERLAGGQAECGSINGDAVNAGLIVQNEISMFLAGVAEQESVSSTASKEFIITSTTVNDVGLGRALDAVSEVVAVDDHC